MGIRKIRTGDDEILRKKSIKVNEINDRILGILNDMADTMYDDAGLGLAAVQVGILRRLVFIDVTPVLKDEIELLDKKLSPPESGEAEQLKAAEAENGGEAEEKDEEPFDREKALAQKKEYERMLAYGPLKLINPEIIFAEGEESDIEGCLSLPGWQGTVKRPVRVKVKALDTEGKEMIYEATGILKKAFCHELDHLEGILYSDLAEDMYEVE